MNEDFLSMMDVIQIGLTLLAIYCAYQRGVTNGFDCAIAMLDDDEDEENA